MVAARLLATGTVLYGEVRRLTSKLLVGWKFIFVFKDCLNNKSFSKVVKKIHDNFMPNFYYVNPLTNKSGPPV